MSNLHSWQPDRRANRAIIRHFIADALQRKAWADTKPADPSDWAASQMSRDMLINIRAKNVRSLARASLEYARYRAFLSIGGHGRQFIDPYVRSFWYALLKGRPAEFYSWADTTYQVAIGGAATDQPLRQAA